MFYLNRHIIKLISNIELTIENFNKIIYFDDLSINIDNIIISGNNLKINYIEENVLKIKGNIESVKFKI